MSRFIDADKLIENCEFFETEMEVKNAPTEDVVERNSVLEMLSKINNAVEDGDGFQYEEWVEYVKDIPSAEKTTLSAEKTTITDGDLIAEIDKLPRIKVGNSNSPTVKYCIDEVLIYDLFEGK